MLSQIEASITAHLTEALQQAGLNNRGVKLHAFPDNAAELGRVQQRVQVLVGYKGASFADTGEEPIQQTMLMSWEVSIQVANLRTHTGAYPLLDIIREAMTGFIPIAGPVRAMRPRSERFADLDQGIWYYVMEFVLPVSWPAEFAELDPGLPEGWEFSGVEVGLWRSLIGGVADPDRSILDVELIANAHP